MVLVDFSDIIKIEGKMDNLIIESAKAEDYESILEMYNELHEVLEECNPQRFRKLEKDEIILTKEDFEKSQNHETYKTLDVCRIDGDVAGFIDYAIFDAYKFIGYNPCTICFLGNIYIKKEFRRQGIGTRFIEYLKNEVCPKYNATRIELEMEAENLPALSFYEKIGMSKARIKFGLDV